MKSDKLLVVELSSKLELALAIGREIMQERDDLIELVESQKELLQRYQYKAENPEKSVQIFDA